MKSMTPDAVTSTLVFSVIGLYLMHINPADFSFTRTEVSYIGDSQTSLAPRNSGVLFTSFVVSSNMVDILSLANDASVVTVL